MRERSKRCGALHGTAPFLVQIWAGDLTAGDRFDAWSRQKRAWLPTGISRPMPTGILRWAITRTGSWVPQASRLPLRGLRCTQNACGTTNSIARWLYRVVVREYGRYYRYSINVNTCIFTRTQAAMAGEATATSSNATTDRYCNDFIPCSRNCAVKKFLRRPDRHRKRAITKRVFIPRRQVCQASVVYVLV